MSEHPYGVRAIRITKIAEWLLPKMFRWQWGLCYEYADNATGEWRPNIKIFETREQAIEFRGYIGEATCFRNWSLKRRRVQRNWEHYRNLRGWTDRDEL